MLTSVESDMISSEERHRNFFMASTFSYVFWYQVIGGNLISVAVQKLCVIVYYGKLQFWYLSLSSSALCCVRGGFQIVQINQNMQILSHSSVSLSLVDFAERQQFWSPCPIFFFPSSTDSSVGIWVCCFFRSLETWLQNPSFKFYLAEALTCPLFPPWSTAIFFCFGWTDFKFVLENRWLTAADSTNWFSCQRSSWFSAILCRLRLVWLCYWFFLN